MAFINGMLHDAWMNHPPVGVWIGVLGLLGVLVPLLRDLSKIGRSEKAMWTVIMFLLLGLELKSVYQDRREHDDAQANDRAEQLRQFGKIAKGIDDTITLNKKDFDATMQKSGQISQGLETEMAGTTRVIGMSNKTLDLITGGDSFCFVRMYRNGDGFDGNVFQEGAHNVFDVHIRLLDATTFRAALFESVMSHRDPPGKSSVAPWDFQVEQSLPIIQETRTGKDESSVRMITLGHFRSLPEITDQKYNIFMMARNGSFTEFVHLHRLNDGNGKKR